MQQKKQTRCGKFSFRLTGNERTHFKGVTIVDFKPLEKTKKIKKNIMVPTLNKDKLFYTPTFIIPAFPIDNVEKFEEEYLRRIDQVNEDHSEIVPILITQYEAIPKNKSEYCAVCKCKYEDYLLHIKESTHVRKSVDSEWQHLILEQARIFKMQNYDDSGIDLIRDNSTDSASCIKDMETNMEQQDFYRDFSVADYLV